ncbi:MAG TPA: hypothetical protein VLW75_06990, partial [Rhizomicrobium sp.]|nr:hypothetical protein [Rhizomicrobium sp.]
IQDDAKRRARRHVIVQLENKPYEQWSDEDKDHASDVCSSYDLMGVVLRTRLARRDMIRWAWRHSVKRTYKIVLPHISYLRRPENMGPGYFDSYTWLYELCCK